MKLYLDRDGDGSWLVLRGGENWACIEGDADEWRAIADGLRSRRNVSFKRCSVRFSAAGGGAVMISPRNAWSESDCITVNARDLDTLADHIAAVCDGPGGAT